MSDIEQRLREAEDGVTPGPWVAKQTVINGNEYGGWWLEGIDLDPEDATRPERLILISGSGGARFYTTRIIDRQIHDDNEANMKWFALCSPDNIGALLAERAADRATIASLRSKLEEAEGARDRLAKKIAACNWYWPEDDTSSEACFESAQEVLDSAYISRGEVLAVARGGVVEVTYCASLPPADEADSDDEFWVEEKTYEAASLKVADEQSRRTLASLREADHA